MFEKNHPCDDFLNFLVVTIDITTKMVYTRVVNIIITMKASEVLI